MKLLQQPDSPALNRTSGLEIQVKGFPFTKIGTLSATKNVFALDYFCSTHEKTHKYCAVSIRRGPYNSLHF